jgi:hypothetical protein
MVRKLSIAISIGSSFEEFSLRLVVLDLSVEGLSLLGGFDLDKVCRHKVEDVVKILVAALAESGCEESLLGEPLAVVVLRADSESWFMESGRL